MLEFHEQKGSDPPLFTEDTDEALPEKLNPNTRYAFFQTIATGGKSLIKSCKDLHLKRVVCYKTLRPEFLDDPVENQRLLREARISANLQHPNTVPTYEIGRTSRGHYYFTMKLVHGYTLREVLNFRERYDLNQLIEVIIQVGYALGYAHSKGVLHRDIKPDNILVGPYGEVLLLDWGLAKVWNRDTGATIEDLDSPVRTGSKGMTGYAKLQGTLMYMSPEQIDKDPKIGFQSDIYSLGALLYETLTGLTPFQGDQVQTLLGQIRDDEPADPRTIPGNYVPEALAALTMQCLKKDPSERPASTAQMVRILKDAI